MRKILIITLLLASAAPAPVLAQVGYLPPSAYRDRPPGGPREEQQRVRDEIRWIDYVFKRLDRGEALVSMGTGTGLETLVPMNGQAVFDAIDAAIASGVIRPEQRTTVWVQWMRATAGNRERLERRRAELVRRDTELAALIRSPSAPPPTLQPWEVGRPPAPRDGACTAEGVWSNSIRAGSSTWTIHSNGVAEESGMGNARGQATLANDVLTITFRTGAVAGVYEIDIFADCSGGDGKVSFTDGPPGFDRSPQDAEFTRVSGPSGAKYEAVPGGDGLPKN